ncbi:MAG: nicotinate (nicotinamide) nucleotide adenylyltransferase [Eubacterium sp.]|nr:nicotinate (nicotinamide) nucleotide adenylyltransferase [Eubacterium sp.]
MKIGIFGGAFNPVHNGHLNIADAFYEDLKLDKLLLIPTANPPHKSGAGLLSGEDRINMLRLAIENKPYEISTIEFERNDKSYTYNTLLELKKLYPKADLFLIIGADQIINFDKWYRYSDILDMVTLCASARENEEEKQLIIKSAQRLGIQDSFYMSSRAVLRVSSSEIRDKIKNGSDVSKLLPKKVFDYISEKGLYRV